MGFLKRMGLGVTGPGRAPAQQPSSPPPIEPAPQMVRLNSEGRLKVVGEASYQPAILAVAQGRTTKGHGDAIPCNAALIPEPHNQWDRNAVRVDVQGHTVGYLGREDAEQYQPPLLALMRQGMYGWCPARVVGSGERPYGVFLHIGPPERLTFLNAADDLKLLAADWPVTVTQEAPHQDVLARYGGPSPAPVVASLDLCEVSKGKNKGAQALEVRVDGERIGQLTPAMSERYLSSVRPMLDMGLTPGCEGTIQHTDKGFHMDIRMPDMRAAGQPSDDPQP